MLELFEVAEADFGLVEAFFQDWGVEGADEGDLVGQRERVQGSGFRVQGGGVGGVFWSPALTLMPPN